MTENQTPSGKIKRDRSLKPCACQGFYAVEFIDGEERSYDTGCARLTNNRFAQGHDAKLVSFLVKADVTGDVIWKYGKGEAHEEKMSGAQSAAATISAELAAKAERAVLNALDKAAARRTPKAQAAPPRPVAVKLADEQVAAVTDEIAEIRAEKSAEQADTVKGKVGRWEYEGTVDADGVFWYETKGGTKSADAGKWTPIS